MKKKLFVVCAIVVAAIFLAACGGGGNSAQGSSGSGNVTLRILSSLSSIYVNLIDTALAEKYPEITLEWEQVDWSTSFHSKMQVYLQSGLPDIMVGKSQDVATYGSQGILKDLTGKAYLDEFMEQGLESVSLDGKICGLPYNALYQGVYYNREIFRRYNLEVPTTLEELNEVIAVLEANGITPFATHFADTWSIGNMAMQFAVNDVFRNNPVWGDDFRAGKVSFATSPEYRACYEYFKLIYDHTWTDEAFSVESTVCDARMALGQAAMKVSGSWAIQNFLDIDETFDFGIFPFPNQTGDSKLLFEPDSTFMASASSPYQDEIDKFFDVIATNKGIAREALTTTSPLIKGVTTAIQDPSQSDIDSYAAEGMIQDVNLGNNQLQWGGFQTENAKDIAEYMEGKITVEQALEAADSRRAISKTL